MDNGTTAQRLRENTNLVESSRSLWEQTILSIQRNLNPSIRVFANTDDLIASQAICKWLNFTSYIIILNNDVYFGL